MGASRKLPADTTFLTRFLWSWHGFTSKHRIAGKTCLI